MNEICELLKKLQYESGSIVMDSSISNFMFCQCLKIKSEQPIGGKQVVEAAVFGFILSIMASRGIC
jgi:hypothetical protein